MTKGLLGRKVGMSEIFNQEGSRVPVTVLESGPCAVLAVKKRETDGYDAIMVGFDEKPEKRCTKPELGLFKKAKVSPKRFIREFQTEEKDAFTVGQTLETDCFSPGELVDVTGVTIGKGFQGGVKRWGWTGGKASHGSMHHRAPGSIGASSDPSRVFKGQHLPGHMGSVVSTAQGLEVVLVDKENHLLVVKGAVPGKDGYVVIRPSRKQKKVKHAAPQAEEKKEEKKKDDKAEKKAQKKEEKPGKSEKKS